MNNERRWASHIDASMEAQSRCGVNPFMPMNDKQREQVRVKTDEILKFRAKSDAALKEAKKLSASLPPGRFKFLHSPANREQYRWIVHTPDGDCVGEFNTSEEAMEAMRTWNSPQGELVTSHYVPPPPDADESHRGTYIVGLKGTRFRKDFCGTWHSSDLAIDFQTRLRNVVCKYGFDTVSEILFAGQTSFTKYGWTAPDPEPPAHTFEI